MNVQVIVDRPVRLFYQPAGPKSDHVPVDLKPLEANVIKLEVWEAIVSNPTQRQVVENLAESKILEWTDESTVQKMIDGTKPFPQPQALDAEKEAAKIGQEKLAAAFKKK